MDGIKRHKIVKIQEEALPKQQLPAKQSCFSFPLRHKFLSFIALVSLVTWAFPHQASAAVVPAETYSQPLVFVLGSRLVYIDNLNFQLDKFYTRQKMQAEIDRQLELGARVKEYLAEQNSPLADYAYTLIQLSNWKKIIALSNAESGLCRHYPINKANCWGVGGPSLWYMGSNLQEGIVSMNQFLNTYPNNSQVKYAQMTFKQMNGLYKQPAAKHWVDNNQSVYDDLTAIENSL